MLKNLFFFVALSKELAASVTALNDIGSSNYNGNGGIHFSTHKKFNSNDNLLDELENGVVSGPSNCLLLQQEESLIPTDLERMMIEKAKCESYMKYLDLQQQQQLLLTPKQLKGNDPKTLKYNRSSTNSSPITSTTTTNSSSCIVSPSNSMTRMQDAVKRSSSPHLTPKKNNNNSNTPPSHSKRSLSRQNYSNLSPQQNENDYYMQSNLKPISILVQNQTINSGKSASPSPSPKANEIWLEYGCI